ncbi:MAG: hypothetical protein KKF56_01860 [Nanoarchaeota archaeon]|nr:hypothetical protein [Nanoarchaeota archaeon]
MILLLLENIYKELQRRGFERLRKSETEVSGCFSDDGGSSSYFVKCERVNPSGRRNGSASYNIKATRNGKVQEYKETREGDDSLLRIQHMVGTKLDELGAGRRGG